MLHSSAGQLLLAKQDCVDALTRATRLLPGTAWKETLPTIDKHDLIFLIAEDQEDFTPTPVKSKKRPSQDALAMNRQRRARQTWMRSSLRPEPRWFLEQLALRIIGITYPTTASCSGSTLYCPNVQRVIMLGQVRGLLYRRLSSASCQGPHTPCTA